MDIGEFWEKMCVPDKKCEWRKVSGKIPDAVTEGSGSGEKWM